ncbi:MAG: O-antigen ligase family protein [Holosporales bacterium]|jgi:O-antigen ligase|nr:O-antigen ligase family protein [Holosporales bacterium]
MLKKTPLKHGKRSRFRRSFISFFQKVDFLPYVALIFPPCGMFCQRFLNGIATTLLVLLLVQHGVRRQHLSAAWSLIPRSVLYSLVALLLWMGIVLFWCVDLPVNAQKTVSVVFYFVAGSFISSSLMQSSQKKKTIRYFTYGVLGGLCLLATELSSYGWLYKKVFTPDLATLDFMYSSQATIPGIIIWPLAAHLLRQKHYVLLCVIAALCTTIFKNAGNESARMAFLVGSAVFVITLLMRKYFLYFLRLAIFTYVAFSPVLITKYDLILKRYSTPMIERLFCASERLNIWRLCIYRILNHPFQGYGVGSIRSNEFLSISKDHGDHYTSWVLTQWVHHTHNAALEIWEDLGIIGILIMLYLLDYLFRSLIKAPLPLLMRASFCASICAALSVTLTCFSFWHGWWIFLFCLMAPIVHAFVVTARAEESP